MARILPGVPVGEYRTVSQCRAMSRNGAGRGIPRVFRYVPLDRLQRSRPHFQWNGCRVCCVVFALSPIGRDFSREPGRVPGAGAGIRAGKGSVTAPGVPVPVTVYGLVQVARYGAVAVPHALSHCPAVKYGIAGFAEFCKGRHALSHCPAVKYGALL